MVRLIKSQNTGSQGRCLVLALLVCGALISSPSLAFETQAPAVGKPLSIENDLESLKIVDELNAGLWHSDQAGLMATDDQDEETLQGSEEDPTSLAPDLSIKSN